MRKLLALAALALCIPAAATAGIPQRVAALEGQVRALRSTVGTLRGQVGALQQQNSVLRNQANTFAGDIDKLKKDVAFLGAASVCTLAVMSDTFHATWAVVDVILTVGFNVSPAWGPQQPADDRGACAAIGVTRG